MKIFTFAKKFVRRRNTDMIYGQLLYSDMNSANLILMKTAEFCETVQDP